MATLPLLLTALLFAIGLFALMRILAQTDIRAVAAQVRATPWSIAVLALCTTFASYTAQALYDWPATRIIGRKIPFTALFLGGFLSHGIGNTIGLSAVTGGAVRYRIYAALGLDGYEVAAITAIGSFASGVGFLVIGLLALLSAPDVLTEALPLRAVTVDIIVLACLALIAMAALVTLRRRSSLKIASVTIEPPNLRVLLLQLALAAAEILLAAATLYLLLPSSDLSFFGLLAIFAAAILLATITHIPGGVGVFETLVLLALPATIPTHAAAASLIMFRLIYFIAPFGLSLVILALNEWRLFQPRISGLAARLPGAAVVTPILQIGSATVPLAMAAMTFGSGLLMLLSALIPRTADSVEIFSDILLLAFIEGAALLSSAIGTALLVIAHGLLRRIEGAYWLALFALLAGAVTALVHEFDINRALALAAAALILYPCRREFYRNARLTRDRLSYGWFALILAVLVACAFVFFFAHKSVPYSSELWWQFALNKSAPRSMRAGLIGSLLIGLVLLIHALRVPRITPLKPDAAALDRAAQIIARHGDSNANLALAGDKSLLFSDNGQAFLMYGQRGQSWIALGDPVGPEQDCADVAWTFADAARAASGRPVFYEVSEANLPLWLDMGLALHKMGEEAVVPLAKFTLDSPDAKKLRTTHARALRDGLSFQYLDAPHSAATFAAIKIVSGAWIADKAKREKSFSVGRFDADYLNRFPLALVYVHGKLVAFANVLTTNTKAIASIDLMRHDTAAPSGTMEFLFTELILTLKSAGFAEFSLGMAPLSGMETRRGAPLWSKFGAIVFRSGSNFYNFAGLRGFKNKFDPEWRPRYLATPSANLPLLPLADAAYLINGGFKGVIGR